MAIFPVLNTEGILQVVDKTRLDATKTFVSKGEAAITLVRIRPEASESFIDVTGTSTRDYYLDWEYSGSSRTITATVEVTTDGAPITLDKTISILTAADDKLFSDDKDIIQFESDVLKYVEVGRNSYLNKHRAVQGLIIDVLNDEGIVQPDGTRITKDVILDIEEVNTWSKFWVLALIFDDFQNSDGDKFQQKADMYFSKANNARNKSFLRLDINGDGSIGPQEFIDMQTKDLVRS